MAAKKKQRARCSHSQSELNLNYKGKKSPSNNLSPRDYSDTILHRLRPRINGLERASETVYKVCAAKTCRKKTRPPVKRCCVDKVKRRYRRHRNPRINLSSKSVGDVRSRTFFVRSNHPAEKSLANGQCETNNQKPKSFIQSIRDYIFSTFREGTRWATKYVYWTFKSGNNSQDSLRSSKKEERPLISSSSLRTIEPRQRDSADKPRKGCKNKITKNNQHGDEASRSNGIAVTSKGCPGNFSGENPGSSETVANGRYRNCNVVKNLKAMRMRDANEKNGNSPNKRGQTKSQCRRKRRKKGRPNKRIAGSNVIRYKKVARKIRERRSYLRNNLDVINSKKPAADANLKIIKDCCGNVELEITDEGNQRIINSSQSITSEMDRMECSEKDESSIEEDYFEK